MRVVGHYAYLAEGIGQTVTNDAGAFEIIDVSDSADPVRIGGIATRGRANGIQVTGNYAYVPESTRWTGSNLLGALEIFDVSTPTNPLHVATYDTGGSATSVDVSGGHAYLADGVTDLEVLDVSNPASPRRVGGYNTDEWNNVGAEHGGAALQIQVVGGLVYSAGEDGLHILDVNDPANPVRVGGLNDLPFDYAFRVSGHYACAAFWSSLARTFLLSVFDVSDPTNLARVATSEIFAWPDAVQIVGHHMYLAGETLLVYEIRELPVIRASRSGGTLVLTWDDAPGFILQRNASLSDPDWSDVPGSEGQTRIERPFSNDCEFFRLVKP